MPQVNVIMEFNEMSDKEFFTNLIQAGRDTHKEYCHFKAAQTGLAHYSEPDYEAALEHAKTRIEKMK